MQKDIIIIGSGLSALITSLALSYKYHNRNIKIFVGEKKISPSTDIRNICLTSQTKEFLSSINVWPALEAHVTEMRDVYVIDNQGEDILHLKSSNYYNKDSSQENFQANYADILSLAIKGAIKNKAFQLGFMINFHDLYNNLLDLVLKNPKILIVEAEYQETEDCEYRDENLPIILAQSNKSQLKNKYFNKLSYYKDHNQTALVFNIKHSNDHEQGAIEHFTTTGTFAALPTKDPKISCIVWCLKGDIHKYYSTKEKILNDIYEKIGLSYGKIEIISDICKYPLSTSISEKYFNEKFVLVGDAAHIMHPLAGLGLNQGIKDIKALVDLKIFDCDDYNHQKSLEEYQKQRSRDNLKTALSLNFIDEFFNSDNKILRKIRSIGFKIIGKI